MRTLCETEEILLSGLAKTPLRRGHPKRYGRRGGQPVYPDIAIETSLSLRLVFLLSLRQTEGFLESLLRLMRLDLPCPDH
ncbi:transposase [Planctomycetota bacterium]